MKNSKSRSGLVMISDDNYGFAMKLNSFMKANYDLFFDLVVWMVHALNQPQAALHAGNLRYKDLGHTIKWIYAIFGTKN